MKIKRPIGVVIFIFWCCIQSQTQAKEIAERFLKKSIHIPDCKFIDFANDVYKLYGDRGKVAREEAWFGR